jgi:hypothetical protein
MAALCFGHASLRSGHAARRSSWKGVDERDNRRANRRPAERPKGVRFVRRRRTRRLRDQGRRVLLLLGPSGCGKTTTLQDDRRLRAAVEPVPSCSRASTCRRCRPQAQRQHRVPAVRAVPAPLDRRQRRLRPPLEEGAQATESRNAVDGDARRRASSPSSRTGAPTSCPAASSSGSPSPEPWSTCPALLLDEPLAALDLKLRESMQIELKRIQRERRHHLRVRHPRSGGGAHDERPHRGHEPWSRRADRHPFGDLRPIPRSVFVAGFIGTANLCRARSAPRPQVHRWRSARRIDVAVHPPERPQR